MSLLADIAGAGVELILWPLDRLPAWLGLLVVSVATGALALYVVGRTTDQKALGRARDRMSAALYELRLFPDSPRRLIGAQWRLLLASAGYTARTLPALLILAIPLGLLFLHLELRYAQAPLAVGDQVLVRAQVVAGTRAEDVRAEVPDGELALTAEPFFHAPERLVYLRVRVMKAGVHALRIHAGGDVVEKLLVAEPDARVVSVERSAGLAALFAMGIEDALPAGGGVEAIHLPHPERRQEWLLGAPWWAHWLVISTIAALALRRPMRVVI